MPTLDIGLPAGAVGTDLLNAMAWLDTVLGGRPPSPLPDPSTWSAEAWAADAVPRLVYGAAIVLAYAAPTR